MKTNSQYGSHASMIDGDQTVQLMYLGWPRSLTEVVCRDERGIYTTLRNRLDNGLADPKRWDR